MVIIFIKNGQIYTQPLQYILSVFSRSMQCGIAFINEKSIADLVFDHTDTMSNPVNVDFYEGLISKRHFRHDFHFNGNPILRFTQSNQPDWLGTAFYMVNAFQEYADESTDNQFDQHGRFKYEATYQCKYDCMEDNLVQKCFEKFCEEHSILKEFARKNRQSKVFISHDIDTINGSFLQDGLWALKNRRPGLIMKLIMNEILLKPDWKNMERIAKLHDEHDLKDTFFWLATRKIASNGVKNADYNIQRLSKMLQKLPSKGLHKSCYYTTINEELDMLPFDTKLNRYHFLKITLPETWDALDESRITLDASLGFAERYGFRNSYGLPFRPYNLRLGRARNFIEVPLNVMDGTLHRYMKVPLNLTATKIIDFLEKNKTNAIISILWHNTYFTNYKYAGYLQEYKKVLLYLNETRIESITPGEIAREYGS